MTIRLPACLALAVALGACNPASREPGPAFVHRLPSCEDAARAPHTEARDCAYAYGGQGFGPSNWEHLRFTPAGANGGGAVAVDSYSDRVELNVIRETRLKGYDYPFWMDVTGEGGDDVFIPIARADGRWRLSVWLSNFLDDYEHHTGAYIHAGEIPLGRVAHLDRNLFAETASGFKGPWAARLYRALPSRIVPLGSFIATGDEHECKVSGPASAQLNALGDPEVDSICAWFATPRDYYDRYRAAGVKLLEP